MVPLCSYLGRQARTPQVIRYAAVSAAETVDSVIPDFQRNRDEG